MRPFRVMTIRIGEKVTAILQEVEGLTLDGRIIWKDVRPLEIEMKEVGGFDIILSSRKPEQEDP